MPMGTPARFASLVSHQVSAAAFDWSAHCKEILQQLQLAVGGRVEVVTFQMATLALASEFLGSRPGGSAFQSSVLVVGLGFQLGVMSK